MLYLRVRQYNSKVIYTYYKMSPRNTCIATYNPIVNPTKSKIVSHTCLLNDQRDLRHVGGKELQFPFTQCKNEFPFLV